MRSSQNAWAERIGNPNTVRRRGESRLHVRSSHKGYVSALFGAEGAPFRSRWLSVHTARADRSRHAPYLKRPVSIVNLHGEQTRLAGSWCNELELEETLKLVERLHSGGVQLEEIAVITPYRGQLERLRRGFLERRIALESSPELAEGEGAGLRRSGVALGTVHRFQGGERSIVLFSSVVTHASSLAFLNARPNLLNVAISRAQHHFICLGHAATLTRGERSRLLVDAASALSPAEYGGG